jgi:PAS domain S-box-containing protein
MIFLKTAAALVFLLLLGSELHGYQTPAIENRGSVHNRRILILNEVNASYPAVGVIDEAIRDSLQESKYRIEIYREYMETALFPDEADQKVIRDSYVRKYHNRRPDVIITVGSSPLRFLAEEHHKHFAGIPVIFCLSNGVENDLDLDPEFTGVTVGIEAAATLDAALQLLPNTKHVLVVAGTGLFDRQQVQEVKEQLKDHSRRVKISYVTDLAMPELLKRLRSLSKDSIVLFTSMSRDAAGTRYSSREYGPLIASAANVPVFTLFDLNFGYGEVGGNLSKIRAQGTIAGNAVLKILNGESPSDIPVAKAANDFIFDWRALQRWGLKESNLPTGSIVLNRQPTAWELYKWYILGGLALILLEALLISALLLQWRRARKAETTLLASNRALEAQAAVLQSREELLNTFVRSVPAGVAMFDRDMRYLQVSDRWCADYSIDRSQVLGRSHHEVPSDVPQRWKEMHRRGLEGETLQADEDRWEREDGTIKWVRWEICPWRTPSGSVGGILILAEDITQRKELEESVSEMSHKLIESQEQERARIARELHDDIGQRLALLTVELELLQQSNPGLHVELRNRIGELQTQTSEIAHDVQSLSHELHSSKLEYLGLAVAMGSLCREFGEQHKVEIDFQSHDLPASVPQDISLCLFRVLQEALHNSVKHGGARHVEVRLWETSGEIDLTVRDFGMGFDDQAAKEHRGLGLISMQERLKLVKGKLSIESQPSLGTTIRARVPLSTGSDSMRVA